MMIRRLQQMILCTIILNLLLQYSLRNSKYSVLLTQEQPRFLRRLPVNASAMPQPPARTKHVRIVRLKEYAIRKAKANLRWLQEYYDKPAEVVNKSRAAPASEVIVQLNGGPGRGRKDSRNLPQLLNMPRFLAIPQ